MLQKRQHLQRADQDGTVGKNLRLHSANPNFLGPVDKVAEHQRSGRAPSEFLPAHAQNGFGVLQHRATRVADVVAETLPTVMLLTGVAECASVVLTGGIRPYAPW